MNHRFRRSSIAEPDRRIPLLSITFLAILFLPCLPPVFGAHGKCWEERSTFLRWEIARILTLPTVRTPLDSVVHRTRCEPDYSIESITFASEPGSRVTALLYLPRNATHPVPAVILACGHGGSKSCFYAQYAGQLYSKGGFACLVVDTIGEEEREAEGRLGARGHDLYKIGDKVPQYVHTVIKRMILGKIVWDLIRGIDYLETRAEIEKSRIGIVGYSLGGTSAGCVAVLDKRIRAAILCGWVFSARYGEVGKYCTRMAYSAFNRILLHEEMTALLAPHAATLFFCGTEDDVIDPQEHGAAVVRDLQRNIEGAQSILHAAGVSGAIEAELVPGAGHRPFFLSRRAVLWMQEHLVNPRDRRPVPEAVIPFGKWVDSQGKQIEKLYNTERNERGLEAVDCGAVLFDPRELACFPDSVKPDPIYTMEGWIQSATQAAKEQHLPSHLRRWLIEPQIWIRDSTEPILRLGEKGAFDEMHLFAPAVAWERDQYTMLYCGSGGKVEER
ncbi:MAG TPA: acetylxylan esterase, partial [bacterium]|nr:acetylxylan esterase [bacterium]